jgi:glycosyltransferase involved in cell wall biosynthesis
VTTNRALTVSVVIPVKDDARLLRRCLALLAVQSRRPDEIVVVDNGSIDDSPAVAHAGGARVIPCATPGIPAAAAAGYDAARGEAILRLDADSEPGPDWVAVAAGALEARPDVAVFSGGAHFVDGPRWLRRPLVVGYLGGYGFTGVFSLGHLTLFGSNMALRASAWRDVRERVHLDPDVHDDFDLAYHLGERHRIRLLPMTPTSAVGISMRPFADAGSFARRIRAGFRTAAVHGPRDVAPARWTRLLARRLRHRRRSPPR